MVLVAPLACWRMDFGQCALDVRRSARGIGLDLLWFLPLAAYMLLTIEGAAISSAYQNLAALYHRFDWGVLISPSTIVFLSDICASVGLPIQLVMLIPFVVFDRTNEMAQAPIRVVCCDHRCCAFRPS